MPRIDAPTVAEHRVRQRRAILDAARSHLALTGVAPSLAEVGAQAGLARSSVYQYFSSREDLLVAVVEEVLPDWSRRVRTAVLAEPTPGAQVWAYVSSNVDLFFGAEQAVATAVTGVVDPSRLAGPMERFHSELAEPLVEALDAMGEPYPRLAADVIGAALVKVSNGCNSSGERLGRDEALGTLRRLLAGYLDLQA
ncbi:MAG: TetR/AcrR family transcriptional regulator [Nocardioides sp.]|uniref:TetR/AcrR family transcriptional regulator n=1 Tax=Nocardioides sp. TaxID=35761 RepID=UPI003F0C31FE